APMRATSRCRPWKSSGRVASRSTMTTVVSPSCSAPCAATPPRSTASSMPPDAPNVVRTDCSNSPSVVSTTTFVFAACAARSLAMTRYTQAVRRPARAGRTGTSNLRRRPLRRLPGGLRPPSVLAAFAWPVLRPCRLCRGPAAVPVAALRPLLLAAAAARRLVPDRAGGRRLQRRRLVGAIALGGALHAHAVARDIAVRGRLRPRIDDVRDLVGLDRVAGPEREAVAPVVIAVGAAAEQRGESESGRQEESGARHHDAPLGRSRIWPTGLMVRAAGTASRTCCAGSSDLPLRKRSASLPGTELSSGVRRASPGRAGRTRCGVTMMARSVSCFWYDVLRSSAPITGTSASHGNWVWSLVVIVC